MKKIYNVVWIDDEYDKMSAFQEECEEIHGIKLYPFRTQKSGMDALDNNLDKWDGVLLDAKMLDKDENEIPRLVGLKNAIAHINQLAIRKAIPYFISTGQPDLMESDIFEDSYGTYYIKERDDEKLFSDMKRIMGNSSRQQLLTMYSDVVENMNDMDPRGTDILINILEALHFPAENTDFDPLLHYTRLRLLMEYIFRACNKYEIIPSICFDKDNVNLNQCYNYLRGKPAMIAHVRYGDDGDRIVPEHIERILFSNLCLGNANSHSTTLSEADLIQIKELIFKTPESSKYLLFGITLQMCEAIVWFGKYIQQNKDIEQNKSKCKLWGIPENGVEDKQSDNKTGILKIVEDNPSLCCVGRDFCISQKVAERLKAIGKQVKIVDYSPNSNASSAKMFKYFISKLEIIG